MLLWKGPKMARGRPLMHSLFGESERPAELLSPLGVDDCLENLCQSIDSHCKALVSASVGFVPPPWAEPRVVGSVKNDVFRGYCLKWYINSFQTFVTARFFPVKEGPRIQCQFGMHPFVIVVCLIMTGVLLVKLAQDIGYFIDGYPTVAVVTWQSPYGRQQLLVPGFLGALCSLLMLAALYVLFRFGRWSASNERDFLIDFLSRTLHGRPAKAAREPLDEAQAAATAQVPGRYPGPWEKSLARRLPHDPKTGAR